MTSESSGRRKDSSVQSVNRAISILQVIAQRRAAGVIEISEELAVHKSTVSRMLGTLEARGLVEQVVPRGPYQLAHGMVELAQNAGPKHDLPILGRNVCFELARDLGETVNLVVHEGDAVMTVDQVVGSAPLKTVNWVGMRSPLHVTASGKLFLATFEEAELKAYFSRELERPTPYSLTDEVEMRSQLAQVRSRGYAMIEQEQEIGACAVAAPVRSLDGSLVAALTVSGPLSRFAESELPSIVNKLFAAAAKISERLGYPRQG